MDDMPGRFPPPPETGPPGWNQPVQNASQPRGHFPMDINRVFELTFSLFRFRWRAFVATSLIVMIPVSLLVAASGIITSSAANDWLAQLQQVALGQEIDWSLFPWWALGAGLLIGAIAGIGAWVAQAAVTHQAVATYGGRKANAGESVRAGVSRLGAIAAAYLLTFLISLAIAMLGGFFAILLFLTTMSGGRVVPGIGVFAGLIIFVAAFATLIFVSIRWTLVVPAIMVEGVGATAALGRSWRLVSGSSWRVLAYVLAFGLIFGLIELLFTIVLSVIVNPASLSFRSTAAAIDPIRGAIISFGSGLIGAALMPFTSIAITLLYLDLRFRRGEPVPQPGEGEPTRPTP